MSKKTKKDKIEILQKLKEHVNIVFIGHVDAGKSTISGQLMYLSGQVDKRNLEKIKIKAEEVGRESWSFAFVMDVSEEERERGKTVEVARAYFETDSKRYTILDAPGHKAYVPSMIGGCSQADIAVLVISARKGEFETGFKRQGQTREHTTIAKTLGITQLVVVVNKMDEETVEWSKLRFDEIVKGLQNFLYKDLGFSKRRVKFIPISGLKGENIIKPMSSEVCPWYKGKCLRDTLDGIKAFNRNSEGPVRVPVIDKFKEKGCVVVLGKVESGTVVKGKTLLLMPNHTKVEVVEVRSHDNKIESASPGENVQVYLKGVNDEIVYPGMVLCSAEKPLEPIEEFLGNIFVLDKPIFAAGYSVMCHVHTIVTQVTVVSLIQKINRKTGKKEKGKPRYGKNGDVLLVRFKFERPVCVEKYDVCKALGRFTLREEKTVAVGKIMKVKPMKV